MSSKVTLTVELTGHSFYVSDLDMTDHLEGIAEYIGEYAKRQAYEDYNRKISTSWEEQEDANLEITAQIGTE